MRKTILVVAILLAFAVSSLAQSNHERDSLRGVKSLHVVVENMDTHAEKLGLTRQQIQTDVELRLRKASIRVEPPTDPNDFNTLYINVNVLDVETGFFAYAIKAEFQQVVLIPRLKKDFLVPTWDKSSVGVVGRNRAAFVREGVADLVDIFINDFLAVNPK